MNNLPVAVDGVMSSNSILRNTRSGSVLRYVSFYTRVTQYNTKIHKGVE